jgi:hypothetical protein
MEIILPLIILVGAGAIWYFNRSNKLDVNNDGKVDLADAKAAVDNTVAGVKAAADVNNDGKVDAADVVEVKEKAKKTVKKAATKATEAVKKTTRKPRAPKAE